MPYRNKYAGGSTYEMANKRRKSMTIIAVVGVIIFVIILFVFNNTKSLGIGGIGFFCPVFPATSFP